jgi:hypothetical protein
MRPVLWDHRGFEAAVAADGYRNAGPGRALGNAVIEAWRSTLEFVLRSAEPFAAKAAVWAPRAWIEA